MGQKRCKFSNRLQLKALEFFVLEVTARSAADHELLGGEVEADESYFGGVRKGKRGRGPAGKIPLFGLLKHGGKVFVLLVADAKSASLLKRKIISTASQGKTSFFS